MVLLLGLFLVQRRGTGRVGGFFGPVMVVWFVVHRRARRRSRSCSSPAILLRAQPALRHRAVCAAIPWRGFVLLGAVVLAVTGAEALYADMGHFGRAPDPPRLAVLRVPGAAAELFRPGRAAAARDPRRSRTRSIRLAPDWALYPLVVLASVATVIASQAVISGAFSMTRQAVQLGYLPRLEIRHTSEQEIGQIYVPTVNLHPAGRGGGAGARLPIARTISAPPTASPSPARWRSTTRAGADLHASASRGWNLAARGPALRLLPDRRSRRSSAPTC